VVASLNDVNIASNAKPHEPDLQKLKIRPMLLPSLRWEKPMETDGLKLFLAVLELGSLTKAASALDTNTSAISRQIALLEGQCGGSLFHRTGRGMVASELGQRMVPRAKRVLAETESILAEAQAMAGIPSGEIKLGLLPNVATVIARQLFQEVKARFPRVRLVLFEGYTGQLEEWLDQGKIDIAVLFHYGRGIPANQDLLAKVDACLISGPGNRLTRHATVEFEKLDGLPLVLPSSPNALRATLETICRQNTSRCTPLQRRTPSPFNLNWWPVATATRSSRSLPSHPKFKVVTFRRA